MELSGLTYQCTAGETFDLVALILYGDEKYAGELMAANPALCTQVVFIGGEQLQVPVVEVPEEDEAAPAKAPWKE
ncbi:MAG: tail protein X [Christensenellales bacterium]|jgi:hypothetical protein